MIKCLVKECNASVNGESSVFVGLASGGSSKGLRVLEHPLALIYPTQTYLLRSFLNDNTSQSFKQAFLLNLHSCLVTYSGIHLGIFRLCSIEKNFRPQKSGHTH